MRKRNVTPIEEGKEKFVRKFITSLVERRFEELERQGKVERFTDAVGETRWRKVGQWQ